MWIPCFVSVLALQLSAAMAASIITNFPVGTCLTLQCSRETACREVYDPQTQIITPRCLRNVRPSDVCGAAGQPLYTIVNGTIMGAFCGRGFNRITCPPGYWCNIDPVDRFADCCPSSSLTKPGQCSSLPISMSKSCITECSNDRQCPGDQKCCVNGCNVLCTSPVIASTPSPGALTCANVLCTPGGYCVDTPAGPACRQETPVTSTPKPGQCPAIGADGPGICVSRLETCLSDSECLGSLKCCANACGGTVCVPPQTQTPRTCADLVCTDGICEDSRDGPRCIPYKVPAEKSGFCPPLPYTCTPSDPNAPYCLFPAECDTDFNCPGNKKCCATCIKCRECLRPNITDPLPTQPFCDKPCAPGHRCVDTGIRCRRAPCPTYQCVPIDPCSLPADSGLCLAAFPRYYYAASGPRPGCRTFIYGGCGGNQNNFLSLKDCLKTCGRNDDD